LTMDIPWICSVCGYENMIDLENLSEWPLDKIVTAQGYTCTKCGTREAISNRTLSLAEAERKLSRYRPRQDQFKLLFGKLVRKQEGLNERGEHNGAFERKDMASPGSLV